MSFASLRVFTYAYPVSFLSKCHAKNRKEVLALLSCSRKEVLAVSRTQAQATRNQTQEELLLADAKRSSCVCIIFGLYCTVGRSIATSPWATTASFPSSVLACADSVLLAGGSLRDVAGAAGVNSLKA